MYTLCLASARTTDTNSHPTNWRRITLAALMLASKVWEDLAVHNRDILRYALTILIMLPCV